MLRNRNLQALAGVLSAIVMSLGPRAAAAAEHAQMLRQLILDAAQGHIDYATLSPGLAQAVRPQAAVAQSDLAALGPLEAVTLNSTNPQGMELYRTDFQRGALEWAFHVNDQGLIDNAIYRPAKAASVRP